MNFICQLYLSKPGGIKRKSHDGDRRTQQQKPPQREACAPRLKSSPHWPQLKESPHSSKGPAQPQINK